MKFKIKFDNFNNKVGQCWYLKLQQQSMKIYFRRLIPLNHLLIKKITITRQSYLARHILHYQSFLGWSDGVIMLNNQGSSTINIIDNREAIYLSLESIAKSTYQMK